MLLLISDANIIIDLEAGEIMNHFSGYCLAFGCRGETPKVAMLLKPQ